MSGLRTCRGCGCTDDHACPGGCSWVEWDLCSTCAGQAGAAPVVELLATIHRCAAFVDLVASMRKDGELDETGEPWYSSAEDCHDTLHVLISRARETIGVPDLVQGSSEEAAKQRTALALAARSTIQAGERRIFRSTSAIVGGEGHPERSGEVVEVVRPLRPDEEGYEGLPEVGAMYRIRFADGLEADAFEEEIQEAPAEAGPSSQ